MTLRSTLLPALAAGLLAVPLHAGDCPETAEREAHASVAGAQRVRVLAGAGSLQIEGHPGLTEVRAHGTACASSREILDRIGLTAESRDGEIVVKTVIPDRFGWGFRQAGLDLVVEVPAGLALDVKDSSGALEIRKVGSLVLDDGSGSITIEDVTGDVRIDDGSGGLDVHQVSGDVTLTDGSGSIQIRKVGGSVRIDEDGSGGIDISDVKGSVSIGRDGSGGITVTDVQGDFTVDHDGSGGIDYSRIGGRVSVPHRH